jgi:hypothetical protein
MKINIFLMLAGFSFLVGFYCMTFVSFMFWNLPDIRDGFQFGTKVADICLHSGFLDCQFV